MPYALSANTAATLSSFFSLQDQMGTLQQQLASGKKINDPSDNMAVYFKAQSYQTKADFLDDTNGNISLALDHLKLTNKGLGNMIDNLKSARQSLVDALSKPAAVGGFAASNFGAANAAGGILNVSAKSYNNVAAVAAAAGAQATVKQDGAIVGGANDVNNNAMFQVGDVFAVTVQDSSNGTTSTRYFKAAAVPAGATADAATAAANTLMAGNAQVNGTTFDAAFSFYDLKTMAAAIQQAFGTDTLTANTQADPAAGATGGVKFGLALASTNQTISFAQVRGQGGAGDVSNANAQQNGTIVAAFDFSQLMGTTQTAAAAYGGAGTSSTITLGSLGVGALNAVVANGFTLAQQNAQGLGTTTSYTYGGIGGQANAAGVAARQQAATQLGNTLISVDNLLNAGGLPGFVNLFAGQAMNVNVTDDGSQQYNVTLGAAVTVAGLGFQGYVAATGQTAYSGVNGGGFNQNGNINLAIAAVDGALNKLNAYSATITAATAGIASRLDFNKSMVESLKAGVSNMTAINTADVSANLTNMQNAGTLLLAAMAKNGQVDQSISRLF